MLQLQTWFEVHDSYHGPSWEQYFGLGFHMMDAPWGMAIGHGGSNGDFKCRVEVWPEQNCGWVMFTNADYGELLYEKFRLFLTTGRNFE